MVFSISIGIAFNQKPNVPFYFQPNSNQFLCKNRHPDQCFWFTFRLISNLGYIVDTFDMAQATFDSSSIGLDADTCWIDSLVMDKTFDPNSGYIYSIDYLSGFQYSLNHRFRFQVKGYGSIPAFTDTIRSPIHDISVTSPEPYDTIFRGQDLTIHWVTQNDNNIMIEATDGYNTLIYAPLIDNGTYTIPAASLDSLASGEIGLYVGREALKFGYVGFSIIALSAILNSMPIELQEVPGIADNEHSIIQSDFSPRTTLGNTSIYYSQSKPWQLDLQVYDISGHKIREIQQPGQLNGTIIWDRKDENGRPMNKGIYFYHLQTADSNFTGKFIILE